MAGSNKLKDLNLILKLLSDLTSDPPKNGGNILDQSSLLYVRFSDREPRKRQFDARNDISRNLKISDSIEDKVNDRKAKSSDSKGILDEQV